MTVNVPMIVAVVSAFSVGVLSGLGLAYMLVVWSLWR